MRLELANGVNVDKPTDADIAGALSSLDTEENTFAILSATEGTYVQVARVAPGAFLLEYQEGSVNNHYEAADAVPLDRIIALFQTYARGDASWRTQVAWKPREIKGGCFRSALLFAALATSLVALVD